MELWISALTNLAIGFPVYLVLIVGMILAALRRREAPTRYGLVLAALALYLIVSVGGTVINSLLPALLIERAYSQSSIAWVFGAVGVVSTLGRAVAWAMLLAALFWQRAAEYKVL